jgi:hypothetical protein
MRLPHAGNLRHSETIFGLFAMYRNATVFVIVSQNCEDR